MQARAGEVTALRSTTDELYGKSKCTLLVLPYLETRNNSTCEGQVKRVEHMIVWDLFPVPSIAMFLVACVDRSRPNQKRRNVPLKALFFKILFPIQVKAGVDACASFMWASRCIEKIERGQQQSRMRTLDIKRPTNTQHTCARKAPGARNRFGIPKHPTYSLAEDTNQ